MEGSDPGAQDESPPPPRAAVSYPPPPPPPQAKADPQPNKEKPKPKPKPKSALHPPLAAQRYGTSPSPGDPGAAPPRAPPSAEAIAVAENLSSISIFGESAMGLTAVELGTLKHNKKHAVLAEWLSEVGTTPSRGVALLCSQGAENIVTWA